jgi:hypothetical protein
MNSVCGSLISISSASVMNLSAAKVYTDKPLGKKTIQGNSERYSLPSHPYKAMCGLAMSSPHSLLGTKGSCLLDYVLQCLLSTIQSTYCLVLSICICLLDYMLQCLPGNIPSIYCPVFGFWQLIAILDKSYPICSLI